MITPSDEVNGVFILVENDSQLKELADIGLAGLAWYVDLPEYEDVLPICTTGTHPMIPDGMKIYSRDHQSIFSHGMALMECWPYVRRGKIQENTLFFLCGIKYCTSLWLYFQLVNSSIMASAKVRLRKTPEQAINLVLLKSVMAQKGIDLSGHIVAAVRLDDFHVDVYIMSIILNLLNIYDGTGLYLWGDDQGHGGLPIGRWHTIDDYLNGLEFGLSSTSLSPRFTANAMRIRRMLGRYSERKTKIWNVTTTYINEVGVYFSFYKLCMIISELMA
jgi:hypothetical protein